MASKRANLKAKAQSANRVKGQFNMDPAKSMELREVLLEITNIAFTAYDALEADMISQYDIFTMLRLPVEVNYFTQAIQDHAKAQLEKRPERRPV